MNIESYRDFCIRMHAVTEEFPFDNKTLVFKVAGKMFALTDVDEFQSINLKCDPEIAIERRGEYPAVQAGYHMNKKHWNTVTIDGSIADKELEQWIVEGYDLVVSGLTKKQREEAGF